ncbi:hypothetical protein Glove_126g19 [Diversispora epigaea]|uniref:N-acetylmuramoyl-L-alanine amidase domain-containing protein n=1 Tax=Diversispora epigaea TaxID=1348612 RepID=A0A397IYC2_9GLOM|nr:hypothetical protein Glove_126g19 [Diversispora epigaea]
MDYIPVVTPFLSESESEGQLIFNGTKIEVPFNVINFEDDERGYSFTKGERWKDCFTNRTDPTGRGINTIVLHWDVCVSSKQCFQTLCLRQLSTHLMIDTDGQVYQPLDIKYKSFHALSFNNRSISIQIANPVYVSKADSEIGRKIITSRRPGTNETFEHLDFTFEQKVRVIEVVETLCELFKRIPRRLPPLDNDGLISNALIPDFTGVCAHYNCCGALGPGDSLWPILQESFRNRPPYAIRF